MMDLEKAKELIADAEDGARTVPFNFGALPEELANYDGARVVILPVPYDLTATYLAGSRAGPRAIIEASRNMELYDDELCDIPARFGIHTFMELEADASGPERMTAGVEGVVSSLLDAGKIVAALGGEHTITCGVVKAYTRFFSDLAVLHLDAHADLRDSYQGSRYSHACTMRRVRELVGKVSHVGIRSFSAGEADHINREKIKIHPRSGWKGSPEQVEQVLSELGGGPVYVTCDLDVFDPAYVPSTGTPEPGGLGWSEVIALLRSVGEARQIVGFDVVELAPTSGNVAPDFLAARLVYKLVGFACFSEKSRGGSPL
jgi:agmatinase